MLTDLQRDILIKAAEGIQEGMWCRNSWFTESESADYNEQYDDLTPASLITARDKDMLVLAAAAHRCAEGEIALQTAKLGGGVRDYDIITSVLGTRLHDDGQACSVIGHNDSCQNDLDTFTAGQEWARIFREVAES